MYKNNDMTPKVISNDSANFTCNCCNMKFTKSCNLKRHKIICSNCKEKELQTMIESQNNPKNIPKKCIFN